VENIVLEGLKSWLAKSYTALEGHKSQLAKGYPSLERDKSRLAKSYPTLEGIKSWLAMSSPDVGDLSTATSSSWRGGSHAYSREGTPSRSKAA